MSKTNSSENSSRIVPDNPTPTVQFRPHHFLCALGFQGKGYSDDFTANMVQIVDETLRAPGGDDQQIEIVRNTDDICAPCPKRRGLRCSNQDGIEKLDKAHLRALLRRIIGGIRGHSLVLPKYAGGRTLPRGLGGATGVLRPKPSEYARSTLFAPVLAR